MPNMSKTSLIMTNHRLLYFVMYWKSFVLIFYEFLLPVILRNGHFIIHLLLASTGIFIIKPFNVSFKFSFIINNNGSVKYL
jgi:hypothetical protein